MLLQHPGSDCCCAFEKCIQVPEAADAGIDLIVAVVDESVVEGIEAVQLVRAVDQSLDVGIRLELAPADILGDEPGIEALPGIGTA